MTVRTALSALLLSALAAVPAVADARERAVRASEYELANTGGWMLESATDANGAAIAALRPIGVDFRMAFARGRISAGGGCDHISGSYSIAGKRLEIGLSVDDTHHACDEPKQEADRRFAEAMTRAFEAELVGPQPYRMRLTGDGGEVLVFKALPIAL